MTLPALPEGFRLVVLDEVDSTNRMLMDLARGGEAEGLVLQAVTQTAGRGRQGRTWVSSPESSLTFSLLRRPLVSSAQAYRWTALAGVAAWQALQVDHSDLWLKWPNDLLVGDRKVAGVLCEICRDSSPTSTALVIGFGLNLAPPAEGWPPELARRAGALCPSTTSLEEREETARRFLEGFLARFAFLESEFLSVGSKPLMQAYRLAAAPLVGRLVRVSLEQEDFDCRVVGVEDSGALRVVDSGGHERLLWAGDVHLSRVGPPEEQREETA